MTVTTDNLAGAVLALLVSVSTVASAIALFRRKPPVAEEMAKLYASKSELSREIARLEARMDADRQEIRGAIGRLTSTLQSFAQSVERALGRIEGKLEDKNP
ncbi:MAG: hypothetical protein IJS32_06835 [Kiritimatiellae bacterium]|nr:hypothetical protein [Kiritimatiellia bacterium]